MQGKKGKTLRRVVFGGVIIASVLLVVTVYFQRVKIVDFFMGLFFTPSQEVARIRDDLKLTDAGKLIFRAAWPELNESEEFNENCQTSETETAVLGCYVDGRIYIYNIVNEELDGIRELTAAHELLHAVYARLDQGEKDRLQALLEPVYRDNRENLERSLQNYSEEERAEELYVRAGTEIADLPSELERHYAEYFTDQDVVAGFYEQYISVFREIDERLEELSGKLEEQHEILTGAIAEYEARLSVLEGETAEFNACARTAGCFATETAFQLRRSELLAAEAELEETYNYIVELENEYDALVEEYNSHVLHGQKLDRAINSLK